MKREVKKQNKKMEEAGRQAGRGKPYTRSHAHAQTGSPPQTGDRASQKFLAEPSGCGSSSAPHLVPQPLGPAGPPWGRDHPGPSPANSWAFQAPARPQPAGRPWTPRAIHHPLPDQSFGLSASSLGPLSFPATCQEVRGRRRRRRARREGPVGGFPTSGDSDAVKPTILASPISLLAPQEPPSPAHSPCRSAASWAALTSGYPRAAVLLCPRRRRCTAAAPPAPLVRARQASLPAPRPPEPPGDAGAPLARRAAGDQEPAAPRRGREPRKGAHEAGAAAERALTPAGWPERGTRARAVQAAATRP